MMGAGPAIAVGDLPDEVVTGAGASADGLCSGFFDLRDQHVSRFERNYLMNLLQACQGDVSRAAREARVPRGTLYRFLNKHALSAEQFRP